jgi:hypothetical protein
MPDDSSTAPDPAHQDGKMREDVVVPRASDEDVIEEIARLAREGQRRQRESGESGPDSSGA